MKCEIPVRTLYGATIPTPLVLEREGDLVRLTMDGSYLGRDVDEELPLSAFASLLAGGAQKNHDLLGLTLETDGGEDVVATIGVGSGYEKVTLGREELWAALGL